MTLNYRQLSIIIPGTGIQQMVRARSFHVFISVLYGSLQKNARHASLPEKH